MLSQRNGGVELQRPDFQAALGEVPCLLTSFNWSPLWVKVSAQVKCLLPIFTDLRVFRRTSWTLGSTKKGQAILWLIHSSETLRNFFQEILYFGDFWSTKVLLSSKTFTLFWLHFDSLPMSNDLKNINHWNFLFYMMYLTQAQIKHFR